MASVGVVQVICPDCGRRSREDPVRLLQGLGMMRRAGPPQYDLVWPLVEAAQARLCCPDCGRQGQRCERARDDDGELWRQVRVCGACGIRLAAERLQLFPNARLCAACQARKEAGDTGDQPAEYCPRCGAVMRLVTSRRRGTTQYEWSCRQCGREPRAL